MTPVTAPPPTTPHIPPRGERYRLTVPSGRTAPRIARDFVSSVLGSTGCAGLADDARLCVSEVVTNAHRHTRSRLIRVEVTIRRGAVTVYVSDDGKGWPPRPEEPPHGQPGAVPRENGRGLLLVAGLAIRWGAAARGGRQRYAHTVWFTLGGPAA